MTTTNDQNAAAEQWRPVRGYEGRYAVSDLGRVRSLHRVVTRVDGQRQRVTGRILSATPATDGRLRVALAGPAGRRRQRVHVLVLEAFVGPRPEGMDGRHADGNYTDNRLSNLLWDTPQNNNRKRDTRRIPRERCSRGHRRIAPNLINGACKACVRAHTSAFHAVNRSRLAELGKEVLIKDEADRHYELIMQSTTAKT